MVMAMTGGIDSGPQARAADGEGIDVAGVLNALRRRWKLIVAVTVLVVAAALAVSLTSEKQYTATARLVFGGAEPINALIGTGGSQPSSDIERELNTNAGLVEESNVAQRVRRRLDVPLSVSELQAKVETDIEENSDIVGIHAEDRDPERAAAIANGFAEEYVAFRRQAARANIAQAAELARTRLESLDAADRASSQGRELEARLRELEIAAALQTGGVELVRPAAVPTSPTSPRPKLTAALAGALGFLLSTVLAGVRELTDRRVKSEDELEELFGLPVLASLPRAGRRRGVASIDDPGQKEGYATLATNLRFFKVGRELRSLMITSPSPGEGKTTTTVGLARALTALGLRVVMIEADLRHPGFERHMDLRQVSGLTSILAEVSTVSEELVELDVATLKPVDPAYPDSGASLWVLPAGPLPPNPQALLASSTMRRVLEEATDFADVVLIDSAPVATVNDAVALADCIDATVLVQKLGSTTKDSVRRAIRLLRHFDAPLLGTLVTNAERRSGAYYGTERTYLPRRPLKAGRA